MTACVNSYEDRFLGNLDRRLGARTSGSSMFVPRYDGGTARKVWRRSDAIVEAPTPTPVARPVAPVVKKPAPVVKAPEPVIATVVEADVPIVDPMPTLSELWELEQAAKERRSVERLEALRKRFGEKPEAPPVVKPPEDFTPLDLSRPKLKKPPKKAKKPTVRTIVQRDLRREMLERIDRLHPEACQAATTSLGAYDPFLTYWTTEAFRKAVEQMDQLTLERMSWKFLGLAEGLSWNLKQREAERAAK